MYIYIPLVHIEYDTNSNISLLILHEEYVSYNPTQPLQGLEKFSVT
jgi:hypothetical protein